MEVLELYKNIVQHRGAIYILMHIYRLGPAYTKQLYHSWEGSAKAVDESLDYLTTMKLVHLDTKTTKGNIKGYYVLTPLGRTTASEFNRAFENTLAHWKTVPAHFDEKRMKERLTKTK